MLDVLSLHFEICSLIFMLSLAVGFCCAQQILPQKEKNDRGREELSRPFVRFQYSYICVYLLAMFSDWLQGPYIYVLYVSYGFSQKQIGWLFVTGFASSAIFGVFVGRFADRFGRKKACLLFCIFYIIACIFYHLESFQLLCVGRIFAGLATSLLFSAFDSWLVCEHMSRRKFPPVWLSYVYTNVTLGNGLVAIVAGLVSSYAAKSMGPVGPFNVSMVSLVFCAMVVGFSWTENYEDDGIIAQETEHLTDKSKRQPVFAAWNLLKAEHRIWLCGIVQSFFEAAMYIFVLLWSPSLPQSLDRGLIFASFMAAVMLGSRVSLAFDRCRIPVTIVVVFYLILAMTSFLCAAFLPPQNWRQRFLAFCVFEVACGIHFTSFYALRGRYIVPEKQRATILNLYRIPTNILVVVVSSMWSTFSLFVLQTSCAALLFFAAISAFVIHLMLRVEISLEGSMSVDRLP